MSGGVEAQRIAIWLTPDRESFLTLKELAAHFGISYGTFYFRVSQYFGIDCDLTYFPGPLPKSVHRKQGRRKAKEKVRRPVSPAYVDPFMARLFVLKLIRRTREDYRKTQCPQCKSFLLNEDGMLYWYLELMFDDDRIAKYMRRQVEFVEGIDFLMQFKVVEEANSLQ